MRKISLSSNGPAVSPAAPSVTLLWAKLKTLVAHCSVTTYEDSTPRSPGWVTIRTRGVVWEVVVKDPDGGASLTASGKSLDDALTLANELVGADNAPWEVDQWLQARKPTKRKK